MYKNYSVLMSVYFKEKPEFLMQSMESILNQTIKTNDFVLVCDGPLNDDLDSVISEMQTRFGKTLHVVRLKKNGGLGNALNEGIKHCKNELVARMDSDDISYSDRCEKQLAIFNSKPEISICSGVVEEFSKMPGIVDAKRVLPEHQQDILRFAKSRNPFNHPCVMYKRVAVEAVGSYQDFYLLEDYFLWLRLLMSDYKGYNIQEPILFMRAGYEMYKRRSGIKYFKSQIKLFKFMKSNNFINSVEFFESIFVRGCISVVPNSFRKLAYKFFARH